MSTSKFTVLQYCTYVGLIVCIFSKFISSMDMKCLMPSRCWYCKELCEHCLLPSGFGPGLTVKSKGGHSLKFCSEECALHFTTEKTLSLDIEILPPRRQHDSQSEALLKITGSGMLNVDEGVKATCLICHGYRSGKYPNGRFFVICQLRSLFSQKIVEAFANEKAILEEPLPHADYPFAQKMMSTSNFCEVGSRIILSSLLAIKEKIQSECKDKEVELNLNILTQFQTFLFGDNEEEKSIKVKRVYINRY